MGRAYEDKHLSQNVMTEPNAVASGETPKVEVIRQGALIKLVLNRPAVLNAFDNDMRQVLASEIPRIARNPDVYVVALMSSSAKAFCAGGDVRSVLAEARQDMAKAKSYFAGEYNLDWLLDCFSKPVVSLINGICMGSGVGLSTYNTHRVAGETYKWAMPETAIGLFPDVGIGHVFARMPWPIGLYLGLTGRAIDRRDGYWLGLATHCIRAERFEEILTALADAQPIDTVLDGMHEQPGAGPLQDDKALIEEFFSGDNLDQIISRLRGASGAAKSWAEATLAGLEKRSPMSLRITDRQLRLCRNLDLRETLVQDYRLACRCLEAPDFGEGVRAALIDKDGAPKWSPGRLEDVTPEMVARYFAPLGDDELNLPTRQEMQKARV